MIPDTARLIAAVEATWPPAETHTLGPVTIRAGEGGGQRVSASTVDGTADEAELQKAEAAMRALGQTPLFMIRPGDEALDTALADRGYRIKDPVSIRLCPIETLTDRALPRVTAFAIWEPLAIMREIWAAGGIGPERVAVMERVTGPKTGLLGRIKDRPGGAGFAAIDGEIAFVHALEIAAAARRHGLGGWMMRCAALWAAPLGARRIAALVTEANAPANALYDTLGMEIAGRYHYRVKPEDQT
ncbi:GNAT family N-acetyltransferase [Litorisediminicola beolgyonensis]|uniref:GNAT family N-acetyltransferase n=1 Tax=Litorisediminicola beolgyonensis TaxID=1173614 RepID=A0ABW3ZI68_9RHOB